MGIICPIWGERRRLFDVFLTNAATIRSNLRPGKGSRRAVREKRANSGNHQIVDFLLEFYQLIVPRFGNVCDKLKAMNWTVSLVMEKPKRKDALVREEDFITEKKSKMSSWDGIMNMMTIIFYIEFYHGFLWFCN